jgi:hypothetical protein
MIWLSKILIRFTSLALLFLFTLNSFSVKAQFPGIPGIPDISNLFGGTSSSADDPGAGQSELVRTFFVSFENYAEAFNLLSQSLGLDAESKKIQQALKDSKNTNTSEADRIANSMKVTSEVSKGIEAKLKVGTLKLEAGAKEKYARAIPFTAKGLLGTVALKAQATQTVAGIQANPILAIQNFSGLSKALPEIPNYISTIISVTKLIVTGAQANNIETKELSSTLGKF